MKITSNMVVGDSVKDHEVDLRNCSECGSVTFFFPQKVMVFSRSGARRMRLWTCEVHPLPDNISDEIVIVRGED